MLAALLLFAGPADVRVEVLPHPPIPALSEQSGLLASRRTPGLFWALNDSGDSARLFAFGRDGQPVGGPRNGPYEGFAVEGASNYDWEDLTSDGERLWIADLGNNANLRRDLGFYVLPEPNPNARKARYGKRVPVRYDDQREFPPAGDYRWDCEAVFHHAGRIWAVTKHRQGAQLPGRTARLYRLESQRADEENVLKGVADLRDLPGWVTGAGVSPDGTMLALLCEAPTKAVILFDLRGAANPVARRVRTIPLPANTGQCESLTWPDNQTVLVGRERNDPG